MATPLVSPKNWTQILRKNNFSDTAVVGICTFKSRPASFGKASGGKQSRVRLMTKEDSFLADMRILSVRAD
jgi:hypothetical protein